MRCNTEKKALPYAFLCMFTVFCCWFFVWRQGTFGAEMDWLSQHSVIPDEFRKQFYETGKLFPEFAGNLGGGQNIYNFAYYGLYSPIFLISYLLPFVKMGDYLMVASVMELMLSVCLFYYWLGKKKFSVQIRLAVSLMFLLAGPMIYQSCKQVMFVNYMPFLCMGFFGVDRYFEKRKSGVYTVSVFLMIMTSFYFSIGGMLVLVLYGLSQYVSQKEQRKEKISLKGFLWDGISFAFPMITAVLMNSILLVPTACAIFGKQGRGQTRKLWSLLIPNIQIEHLVYSGYGIGLTTLTITVLIVGLAYRKAGERILTWGSAFILTIPFFKWMLNGGLYVRGKSLIPFLPLICYLVADYFRKQEAQEVSIKRSIVAYLLTIALLTIKMFSSGVAFEDFDTDYIFWCLLIADSVVMFLCFLGFRRWKKMVFLLLPPVVCLLLGEGAYYSINHVVTEKKTYEQVTDRKIGETITEILEKEDGFYRLEQGGTDAEKSANLNRIWNGRQWISSVYSSTYHAGYQEFRKNVFGLEEPFRNDLMQPASDNPLFQKLMGVKYVVNIENGAVSVKENEQAAPIVYATDRIMSEEEYETLTFPWNQMALMRYTVAKDGQSLSGQWGDAYRDDLKRIVPELSGLEKASASVLRQNDGSYHIQSKKKRKLRLRLPDSGQEEQLLYVQFQVKNNRPGEDVAIWLNGTRNKLSAKSHIYYNGNTTFTYVTTVEQNQAEIELVFGKGDYEIQNIECFLGDSDILKEEELYQSEFQVDWEQTKGNRIQGSMDVKNTGYCVTSIPYDENFEIFVDGEKVEPEVVNITFLGFRILKGTHKIEMIYHAPGVKAGKVLSGLGIFLWLLAGIWHLDMKQYFERYRQIIIYALFGVLSTVVNYVIYFTCTQKWKLDWSVATVIAWIGAVLFAYATNRIFVFERKTFVVSKILIEMLKFVSFRLISLGMEWMTLKLLFDGMHLNKMMVQNLAAGEFIGKTIAQIIVIVANYIFSKKFVF